MRGDLTPLAS